MPRVLRIINRFNLGGITYNVSYLSKYLPASYETLLIGGPEEEGEESSLFIPESLGLKPVLIKEMRRSYPTFSPTGGFWHLCAVISRTLCIHMPVKQEQLAGWRRDGRGFQLSSIPSTVMFLRVILAI